MKPALRLAMAILALASGTGCGDKQAQPRTASTAPTTTARATRPKPPANQSRWAKQVDHVCKPWQERIDTVSPAPTTTASLQAWLETALPLVRRQIAAVNAVKPPVKKAEARRVSLFLDALDKTERALTRYLGAVKANASAKEQQALADAGTAGATARRYALSLGITKCGGYASG